MAKHPEDAADFARDMNRIDLDWRTSKTNPEWCRYLGISLSNFSNMKSGWGPYTPKRRALLENLAQHSARATEVQTKLDRQKRDEHDLPEKLEDYILQRDVKGRFVLSRIVATFKDKQEAELFSAYINARTH